MRGACLTREPGDRMPSAQTEKEWMVAQLRGRHLERTPQPAVSIMDENSSKCLDDQD